MKKHCLIVFFIFTTIRACAWHIVGGELELVHVANDRYRINLILYLDRSQTKNLFVDPFQEVSIYSNGGHKLLGKEKLLRQSEALVPYTQAACAPGNVRTLRVFYTKEMTLSAATFSDPAGYYVSWQDCCRNDAIVNLPDVVAGFSTVGSSTGITFVTDFPPVVKNGKSFINSSPHGFEPLKDYACLGQPYYANVAGTDPDGDELRYTLLEPLNAPNYAVITSYSWDPALGVSRPNYDITFTNPTKPYAPLAYGPRVVRGTWGSYQTGVDEISALHVIPGTPLGESLQITSSGGYLTVTPMAAGLYVFSVRVDEFRKGEKIGSVRRDFQLLVNDGCPLLTPPKVHVFRPDGSKYTGEKIDLSVPYTEQCFRIVVEDTPGEHTQLSVAGLGFATDHLDPIFKKLNGVIPTSGHLEFNDVCLPPCTYVAGVPYTLHVIASDDACPLPARAIAPLNFEVVSPMLDLTASVSSLIQKNIKEDFQPFTVTATHSQGELVTLSAKRNNGIQESLAVPFFTKQGAGRVASSFDFDLSCKSLGITEDTRYTFYFTAESKSNIPHCPSATKTLTIDLDVKVPFNIKPVFENELRHTLTAGKKSSFDIIASDTNTHDGIALNLLPDPSPPPTKTFSFENAEGKGRVSSILSWTPECSLLGENQSPKSYDLRFVATDDNCPNIKADTVTMTFDVQDLPVRYDEFNPPNVFTPNADGYNDTYRLLNATQPSYNLPEDNCKDQFQAITVFDRVGQIIYRSKYRAFEWTGENAQSGTYYYKIDYLNKFYKGVISVLR